MCVVGFRWTTSTYHMSETSHETWCWPVSGQSNMIRVWQLGTLVWSSDHQPTAFVIIKLLFKANRYSDGRRNSWNALFVFLENYSFNPKMIEQIKIYSLGKWKKNLGMNLSLGPISLPLPLNQAALIWHSLLGLSQKMLNQRLYNNACNSNYLTLPFKVWRSRFSVLNLEELFGLLRVFYKVSFRK